MTGIAFLGGKESRWYGSSLSGSNEKGPKNGGTLPFETMFLEPLICVK